MKKFADKIFAEPPIRLLVTMEQCSGANSWVEMVCPNGSCDGSPGTNDELGSANGKTGGY